MCKLKPKPRVLAAANCSGQCIEVLGYPDGSWGILRDGVLYGTWEPSEVDGCVAVLFQFTGIPNVIRFRSEGATLMSIAHGEIAYNSVLSDHATRPFAQLQRGTR